MRKRIVFVFTIPVFLAFAIFVLYRAGYAQYSFSAKILAYDVRVNAFTDGNCWQFCGYDAQLVISKNDKVLYCEELGNLGSLNTSVEKGVYNIDKQPLQALRVVDNYDNRVILILDIETLEELNKNKIKQSNWLAEKELIIERDFLRKEANWFSSIWSTNYFFEDC